MINLHSGGELVTLDQLEAIPTPERTATHVPLPHTELVSMAKYALGYFGHTVEEEYHAIDHEGARYFGLLTLRSEYGDYTDTCGLRNSHDRRFPIGIAFGAKCFVCSNLSFFGDYTIRRKHTAHSKRDLPGLVAGIVEPLAEYRKAQARAFERYKATTLTDQQADHAILRLYRGGIINVTRIADVVQEYDEPSFEEFQDTRSAWRLFNAVTFCLNGRIVENSGMTQRLHNVIDGVCHEVH